MIIETAIRKASKLLKSKNIDSHELDVQIILAEIMGVKRDFFITNNNFELPTKITKKFNNAISRRIKREPVAYIIGKKEFWSEDFTINYSTLVPRPESELMIYKLIDLFVMIVMCQIQMKLSML